MNERSTSCVRGNVRRMSGYVPGEQPRDPNAIKLNTNENPYPPSPQVADAIGNFGVDNLRRYPDPLAVELRTAIAELHHCDVEQIFAGNGSDEVLALCLRAFVEQDGSVGYCDPSYSLYPVLADIQAVERRPVPLGADFEWNMPAGYDASIFFLAQPNAPTSILYDRPTVEQFCDSFGGIVVIDEAYVDFSIRDCADLALSRANVLVARTLSKSYSLAGIRLGYLLGDPVLISALYKIKDSYNLNMLTQTAALAAIQDQKHMRANCERIIATRGQISSKLRDIGFEVLPSQTNFIWSRPPGTTAEHIFTKLKERSIFVRHFPDRRINQYLRITIGTRHDMQKFMSAVEAIMDELDARHPSGCFF